MFLLSMFAVPLVSLVGLWSFGAFISVRGAISNENYNATTRSIDASIATLSVGLPNERAQAYLWLITGRTIASTSVLGSRAVVNKGLPMARSALEAQLDQLSGAPKTALATLLTDLGRLPQIRSAIDAGAMTPTAAFTAYTGIIDAQFQYFYASIQDKSADEADNAIGGIDADYALEMTSRETTLLDGVLADGGQMSASVRELFVASASGRQLMLSQAASLLTPNFRTEFLSLAASPESRQFGALERQVLASSGNGPITVSDSAWQTASTTYLAALQGALGQDATQLTGQSASVSDRLLTEAILAGGVGLAAVIASLFLLVWFGRKVTRDLTRLDSGVRDVADVQLPRVVERLRQGDEIDVTAKSPAPATSSIREVAQIAESFGHVQEAAVAAAVDQARLRIGVNQVFRNISMRSQSLLHRQLSLLDTMERGTSDPAALSDLFRLDHLTTRMRRHAEGLIILSGASPGRGWRAPVPVVDILRAAVAEVEDYVRVDVVSESRDLIVGSAVSDVIHLLAELVENATVFSPPNARIEVKADRVGAGLVAEIEDRGLGLTEAERADINERLGSAPEFDLANSQQLGLFVVSRLAARHNIKVSLRESVYGGTTAVLLLPFGVVVRAEEAEPVSTRDVWLTAAAAAPDREQEWRLPAPTYPQESAEPRQPVVLSLPPGPSGPASTSHLGMPVRVPQANLAPQLRSDEVTEPPPATHDTITARSPEATRNLMILMQQGWERGRADDLDDPEGAPDDGNDR